MHILHMYDTEGIIQLLAMAFLYKVIFSPHNLNLYIFISTVNKKY